MIFLLFLSLLWANPPCESITIKEHPNYQLLQQKIQKKMTNAAHLVTISQEADSVLAKLLTAKSGVIQSWIKKRGLSQKNEEELAKQWRTYYLSHFILQQFPTEKAPINESVNALFSDIQLLAFDNSYKSKVESLLKQAQQDFEKLVKTWPLDTKQQQALTHKTNAIKIYWPKELIGSHFENKPLEFLNWGMAYNPPTNEIHMGIQAKKYPDDATLYAVLAHEMAHAIDPCRWSAFFSGPSPFEKVYQCLRGSQSAGAKTRDDSQMKKMVSQGLLSPEMAQALIMNPTCKKHIYPPTGTQADQLPEAFSDWLSAELFAESSFAKQFPRPDLCAPDNRKAGSSYLSNQDRLTKIYLAQPQISKTQKWPNSLPHCHF